MKQPILKLYGTVVVLFAVLIGFSSYWSVFAADGLREQPSNHRDELQEQRIKRGTIRSADGTLLARSTKRPDETYRRKYPQGELFGHPVGYSFANLGTSGFEDFYDDRLVGRRTELVTVFDSLLGRSQVGEDLETTLDAAAQQIATQGLSASDSGRGAAVAIDLDSGAVRVMASVPGFDPNDIDDKGVFGRLANDDERTPLFNRATQGLFPPGSTFKTVTATAALDTGDYTPDSIVSGENNKEISGVPLQNSGGADYGDISLTTALTNSVNTVWAEVGEKLGGDTLTDYMNRFGFNAAPPIDLPPSQLPRSGIRDGKGKLLEATSSQVDIGRTAIGQADLLVSPLQMATVAQTIGNGGVRLKPYLLEKAFDADGRTTYKAEPERAERVMSEETAAALTVMMKNVVREGTGTAAALSGVDVAGKTGTAELTTTGLNDAWFIGFTGETAVAVMVERVNSQGGIAAAPIAKAILESLDD